MDIGDEFSFFRVLLFFLFFGASDSSSESDLIKNLVTGFLTRQERLKEDAKIRLYKPGQYNNSFDQFLSSNTLY